MNTALDQAILRTLAYFDNFDYPLTGMELFERLWQPPFVSYAEFSSQLAASSSNHWQCQNGFYFLSGRGNIIATRNRGLLNSAKSLKTARSAVKKIRSVPFLRAVLVCNSVGAGTATSKSDIDVLIVAAKGRVWIVRLFSNLILLLFGLRTRGAHQARKVCLSFFVDESKLDFGAWRVTDDDIHFAYWLNQMIPLYDPDNYYARLLSANSWIKKFLPNAHSEFVYSDAVGNGRWGKIWKNVWEKFWEASYGNLVESQARALQMGPLQRRLGAKINAPDKGVILGGSVIKLHENDTRLKRREDWLKKIASI